MAVSALKAIGENVTTQQFRDQASTLLLQTPVVKTCFLLRPLYNDTQRREWEQRISTALGTNVTIHDAMGIPVPYGDPPRTYVPVEMPGDSSAGARESMIGVDMGSDPHRRRAVAKALVTRAGVATPPIAPMHTPWPGDRVVAEFRSINWDPQPNASATGSGNWTLAGVPSAADLLADGRATVDVAEPATSSTRLTVVLVSGRLFAQLLVATSQASDWFATHLGAVTIEDVTDTPEFAALNASDSQDTRWANAVPWLDGMDAVSGRGTPWIALSAADSGALQPAPFNTTLARHYGNELARSFILSFGGRSFCMVRTSRSRGCARQHLRRAWHR